MAAASALVTGGAGFLGSHLIDSLLDRGYEVYCVDNFGSGRRSNIDHLTDESRFEVIEADIRKRTEYPSVDNIYSLASRASPKEFTEFPVQIALTNTEGTRHLLNHAVAEDAKMLYASASEVYGDPETIHSPKFILETSKSGLSVAVTMNRNALEKL